MPFRGLTAMTLIDTPAIEVTYIGGPTAVLEVAGVTVSTDPPFDAAGRDYRLGSVMLRKLVGPSVPADKVGRIDVALVSHEQHPDNLDEAGRALIADVPLVITTTTGAPNLGTGAVGLSPWQQH